MFTHGSSPHTWGIRPPGGRSASGSRFIPTYVGHTSGGATTPTRLRFIPTYVGHTYALQNAPTMPGGSSPHTWGIQQAGFSGSRRPPVHPHIRGAYFGFGVIPGKSDGSSPHTWGILDFGLPVAAGRRFIPTYVGHTRVEHVRLCPPVGSSPHTWGIRPALRWCIRSGSVHPHIRGAYGGGPGESLGDVRFIPTYVGHTVNGSEPTHCLTVHPHIRGAYPVPHARWWRGLGSSPHTWGIRNRSRRPQRSARFIPTYVGHTA